jgi:hypothetical protein
MSVGIPRPSSVTETDWSSWIVILILEQCPINKVIR